MLSPTVSSGLEKEMCKDDFESLQDKSIGEGAFACVWKVRHKISKRIFAIKVMNKENIIRNNMIGQINKEIGIMYKLDHPNIIKLYSHFEDNEHFYLIMEYASKGHLFNLIKKKKKLNQVIAKEYMKELISAIDYLHTRNPPIIHRDIKPENILLDKDGRCKLADFGWANYDNGEKIRESLCGTPEYLAPEIVNQNAHDKRLDIWALGILLFEMLTGRTPFILCGYNNQLYNSIRTLNINWPDDFPHLAKDLISRILCIDPDDRLSLDEIINHQWFINTPSLRPSLKGTHCIDKIKLKVHLIKSNDEPGNNKRNILVKLIKNNENSFKETNINTGIKNKNSILAKEYY